MDIDELYGDDHHRRRDRHGQGYRDHGDHDGHGHHHDDDGERGPYRPRDDEHHDDLYARRRYGHEGHGDLDLEQLAYRLLANKKLLIAAAAVLVIVLGLMAVFLLPLLGEALDYVGKSGVKGVVDRIWQGGLGGK